MLRLESRTASPEHSIWSPLPEETFRRHLVELERRTNAVPMDPQTFPLEELHKTAGYTLPLQVEQQLADDLAYLAAIEEGAQSVAAVCLEEHVQPNKLIVRFAALDLALSSEVKVSLEKLVEFLIPNNSLSASSTEIDALFDRIVRLHFRRLLARLRSDKWEKPRYLSKQHKKPLWQDFANLLHRVQFLYTKREAISRQSVETKLQNLGPVYEAFEASAGESLDELESLKKLIKASYRFCKSEDIAEFVRRLENSPSKTPTAKVASAIKCLRQIEKIGAYWRIAVTLINTSQDYPDLFRHKLRLEFLRPYNSVATTIGYESWATSCHVHAEVQLAVYYDLIQQHSCASPHGDSTNAIVRRPRAIGTSKWLCYMCYLFLRCHDRYAPANTHGRLYDQWTLPDLADFGDEVRSRYRSIIELMDRTVIENSDCNVSAGAKEPALIRWRAEPMTSRQNLFSTDSVG